MPRSPTALTPPPGTLPFVPNTTIESGKANAVLLDLYQDGNTPRPIEYGGTGASNAPDALSNLGGVGQSNFLAAYSIGDSYFTLRDISAEDGVWLRRDGSLYNSADYPELAALSGALPDEIQWTNITTGLAGIFASLTTPDGIYIGSVSGSDTNIYFSSDYTNFALRATIANFQIEGLVSGGGIIGAIDGNGYVSSSNDGVNFSARTLVNSNGFGPGGIAWSGTVFAASGGNGTIYTSPDFVTWTLRTTGVTNFLTATKYLNGNFVVVGSSGTILTAPAAGTPWTARTSGTTQFLYDSTFLDGVYVVVGATGTILSSTNLSSWTPRASGTTNTFNSVTASTSGFLAVGYGGVARISAAGTSWAVSITGVSVPLREATFDPDEQNTYYVISSNSLLKGLRTLPTQFQVPSSPSGDGWIKARND